MDVMDLVSGFGGPGRKYHVVVLVDSYFYADRTLSEDMIHALKVFDRDLKDTVRVTLPHQGREDEYLASVMAKPWSEEQKQQLEKTPALLFLSHDMAAFDPAQHKFSHIHLAVMMDENGRLKNAELAKFLRGVGNAISKDLDLATFLRDARITKDRKTFWKAMEIKPGMFGIRLDVKKAAEIFRG